VESALANWRSGPCDPTTPMLGRLYEKRIRSGTGCALLCAALPIERRCEALAAEANSANKPGLPGVQTWTHGFETRPEGLGWTHGSRTWAHGLRTHGLGGGSGEVIMAGSNGLTARRSRQAATDLIRPFP
jgi:hypothetical protein